ncbi:MAG TPA: peptide chain release factor-like protein [Candidatus Paceibacterota bacterium]
MNQDIKKRLEEIEKEMADASFWQNKSHAQEVVREFNDLKEELSGTGGYDKGEAIVTILSGAGGDDAEDFSRMLYNMYQKYAAKNGFETFLIHDNENDHGGYRNITFEVRGNPSKGLGQGAYGTLKNESGVHRLVRVSPFNAKKLRHTSFSMVEVIPKLPKSVKLDIPDADLRVEFARSSGPGGQNVNKRETAVRVVHIPTNISAHVSSERSQQQNREKAMEILRGKLHKKQKEDLKKKEAGMQISKTTEIEWGSQIRSYVLHPYKMVKDHRTDYEENDVESVFDGNIDEFIAREKSMLE